VSPDLDACEGEAGGGNWAGAPDSGGGLPGSAEDAGNAVEDGDNGGLFQSFLPKYSRYFSLRQNNKSERNYFGGDLSAENSLLLAPFAFAEKNCHGSAKPY
jgi:hypothetical protein